MSDNYIGIDYGLGQANIDKETGIRNGVISVHSLNGDALEDIYTNGDNLTHKEAVAQTKRSIFHGLETLLDGLGLARHADIDALTDTVWDEVEQEFNDGYEEQQDNYEYARDGYVLETTSLGIFVVKSPYYTLVAFCSPCCPGAGDLDAPRENGVKTYCLGADWFEDSKAPYPIYSVATGELLEENANE